MSHQHVLWGDNWNESCEGWTGDLPDLVRANRFEEARDWLKTHTTDHVFDAALYWAAVGGLVTAEFLQELLDKFTFEQRRIALSKQDSEGFTTLMIAIVWACRPEVIRLLVAPWPPCLLLRDKANNDCLQLANFPRQPNPLNPKAGENNSANIALLSKLIPAYSAHLIQRSVLLSVNRQQTHPSILSYWNHKLVSLLSDIQNHEVGLLHLVVSFVGLNQLPFEKMWWRDELIRNSRNFDRIISKQTDVLEDIAALIQNMTDLKDPISCPQVGNIQSRVTDITESAMKIAGVRISCQNAGNGVCGKAKAEVCCQFSATTLPSSVAAAESPSRSLTTVAELTQAGRELATAALEIAKAAREISEAAENYQRTTGSLS